MIVVCLLFSLRILSIFPNNFLNLLLQVFDFLIMFFAGVLKICNVLLHLVLTLLSHESLAHAVSNRTFVKCLVSLNGHLDFVSDTDQKEASFSTIDGDLSDKFIEALSEKFFTEWANTSLSGLSFLDVGIELILQVDNVDLRGGLRRDVTDP